MKLSYNLHIYEGNWLNKKGPLFFCKYCPLSLLYSVNRFLQKNKVFKENQNGNLKEWLVSLNLFLWPRPIPPSLPCPQT